VTDKAKRKWIRFVKQESKTLEDWEKIYISGCGAFKDWKAQDDFFQLYPELDALKNQIEVLDEDPENLEKSGAKQVANEIKNIAPRMPQIYTKKFILIQGWCDSFCTFCLTVQKRWRHFYRDKDDILKEILEFEEIGWKEVVLTGVNLSAWFSLLSSIRK